MDENVSRTIMGVFPTLLRQALFLTQRGSKIASKNESS